MKIWLYSFPSIPICSKLATHTHTHTRARTRTHTFSVLALHGKDSPTQSRDNTNYKQVFRPDEISGLHLGHRQYYISSLSILSVMCEPCAWCYPVIDFIAAPCHISGLYSLTSNAWVVYGHPNSGLVVSNTLFCMALCVFCVCTVRVCMHACMHCVCIVHKCTVHACALRMHCGCVHSTW